MPAIPATDIKISANGMTPPWIALIRETVAGLRYGVVQLVVHDSRVTQIECIERTRLPAIREQAAD